MEIILIVLCVLFVGIAYLTKIKNGSYFLGSENSGLLSLTLSISATWIGSASLIALSGWATSFGSGAIWYLLFPGVGLIGLSFIGVEKIRSRKGISLADYHDGSYYKIIISLFLFMLYALILAAQFAGFAKISGYFDVEYLFGLFLSAIIVSIYVSIGGFESVKNTDIFQFILIGLSVALIMYNMPYALILPDISSVFSFSTKLPENLFMLFSSLGLMMFVAQENHQRIKSAKSTSVAKIACLLSGIVLIIFAVSVVSIGLSVPEHTKDPLLHVISVIEEPTLAAFVAVGILAAALSTADSALNIASYSASGAFGSKQTGISYILLCSVIALLIALFIPSVGKIILICINLYIGVILPTIFAVFLNRSSNTVLIVLLTSSITIIIGYALSFSTPGLIALLLGTLTGMSLVNLGKNNAKN